MNYTTALEIIQNECDNFPLGIAKSKLQDNINVLSDELSTNKDEALTDINNLIYWDVTLLDQKLFGHAMYEISYTVDPNKPFPQVKI